MISILPDLSDRFKVARICISGNYAEQVMPGLAGALALLVQLRFKKYTPFNYLKITTSQYGIELYLFIGSRLVKYRQPN
jgi:hypothetical protein